MKIKGSMEVQLKNPVTEREIRELQTLGKHRLIALMASFILIGGAIVVAGINYPSMPHYRILVLTLFGCSVVAHLYSWRCHDVRTKLIKMIRDR